MGKPKEVKSLYWEEIRPVWWEEIKSWFGWESWKQIMTTIIIPAGTIFFLSKGGKYKLVNEEINVRIASIVCSALWLLIVTIASYVQANKVIYKKEKSKFLNEKRKADRSTWSDIKFSYKENQEDNELIAFTVKIENCKNDTYYFFIELQKLIIDGKNIRFVDNNKKKILSWLSGGVNNLDYGVALNPKDKSKKIGFWKLFDIKGAKSRIVFREYDNGIQSEDECLNFLNSVKGELRLHGVYIQSSIGRMVCGSGISCHEVIRGELIYRFRIDIVETKPQMIMFEEGQIEYCSDHEIIEVMINGK